MCLFDATVRKYTNILQVAEIDAEFIGIFSGILPLNVIRSPGFSDPDFPLPDSK
jgi:hypothetical protein